MSNFFIALTAVLTMLLYAVPGYIAVRAKAIKPDAIQAFAWFLMYIASPCLSIYTFTKPDFHPDKLGSLRIFTLTALLLQTAVLGAFFLLFRKKKDDVRYRIANLAVCFGNCAFMGVPLLEALLPDYPDAVMLSAVFAVTMNLLGWTAGSAIITGDKSYISLKKILLNPTTLSLPIALPLYFTNTDLPGMLGSSVELLGKMTTPLCMLIIGMRLATTKPKTLINDPLQYITVAVKQLLVPLLCLAVVTVLPMEQPMKQTLFIIFCCPTASVVLNFAELLGQGQKQAARVVLLGTLLCVATVPLMMLFL